MTNTYNVQSRRSSLLREEKNAYELKVLPSDEVVITSDVGIYSSAHLRYAISVTCVVGKVVRNPSQYLLLLE